mgnify:CR=1 FL=1|tara:strand:- start:276 stop:521 length:246 start_codon:yes stop_codon:yes gene_type:complete
MAEAMSTAELVLGEPRAVPVGSAVDLLAMVATELAFLGMAEPRAVLAAMAMDAKAMVAMAVALEALAVEAMVGRCMWARPG